MSKQAEQIVITLSRQYGSGGRYIGKKVAATLGIPFYDRSIIDMAAEKSGLAAEYIRANEEKVADRLLFSSPISSLGSTFAHAFLPNGIYSNLDRMFFAQSAIIKELAEKGSCVIIGRCADYVLRDHENCLQIFIECDIDHRIERSIKHLGIDANNAASEVMKRDKMRANYYQHYTDQRWGEASHYHLTIDSGHFGADGCANLILEAVKLHQSHPAAVD